MHFLRRLSSETTDEARRISRINPGHADVLGHDGASTDAHVITNRHRKDGSIRPDTYMVAKLCRPPKIMVSTSGASANKKIINKHRPMRNEAIVANRHKFTDKRVGLNFASLADVYSLLYFNEGPDKGSIANHAPIEIDGLHDCDAFAKLNIDNPNVSKFRRSHKVFGDCPFKLKG